MCAIIIPYTQALHRINGIKARESIYQICQTTEPLKIKTPVNMPPVPLVGF